MIGSVSILRKAFRRFSFPGDSLVLLGALLVANFLRIYFPGLATDGIFCVTILLLGFYLLRGQIPATVKFSLFCFVALLAAYAIGLVIDFSVQGMRNLAGILFACIVFLFSYQNASALTQTRTIFILLAAVLVLFSLYLVPAGLNPHVFSGILGYLLLLAGLILITRSGSRKSQHWWVHVMFLLIAVIGVVFGHRSMVFVALLAYPLYWGSFLFLRSRVGTGVLAVTTGLLICSVIVFLGTSYFNDTLSNIDGLTQKYTGGSSKTGREVLWKGALSSIAESPWFGQGPGALTGVPKRLDKSLSFPLFCSTRENPRLFDDCVVLMEARKALTDSSRQLWNWRFDKPINFWEGVTVGGVPPRIISLDLGGMSLNGHIPPELSKLDQLVALRLDRNWLTGSIPMELAELSNLRELVLSRNVLAGLIPEELKVLDLSVLHLGYNRFSGSVPVALRTVDNHEFDGDLFCSSQSLNDSGLLDDCNILLAIQDNLAGTAFLNWNDSVPINLWRGVKTDGKPRRVTRLDLSGVGLNGSIPPELSKLNKLTILNLHYNQLTGPVPSELGVLKGLVKLRLANNRLSGRIPVELGQLLNLSILHLAGNAFSGCPPSTLYTILRHDLDLSCVPSSLNNPGLHYDASILLSVRDTLSGTVGLNWDRSVPVGAWQGVEVGGRPLRVIGLELPERGLNGRIPSELGELDELIVLNLARNQLAGSIPAELGALNLGILRLQGNNFEGCPPSALYRLSNHDLDFDLMCRSTFSHHLGLLTDISVLLSVRDTLAGTASLNWDDSIPITSWQGVRIGGDPPRVIALDMTDMGLTGFIPSALGRLEQLVGLYLDGNQLTGSVPAELGELKQLNELGLEGNLISGIAKEVEHLANLSVLRWVDGSLAGRMSEPLQEVADTGVSVGGKRGDDVYCRSISRGRLFDLHKDCGVLLSVRDTLSGTVGLNWDRSVPVGAWQGVEVGGRPLRVIGLELPERGLNGRIPSELGELDELIVLNLARNQLAGSIPAELGALNLGILRLQGNNFEGCPPSALYRLSNHDLDFDLMCRSTFSHHLGLLTDISVLLSVRDTLAGTASLNWDDSIPITSWQGVRIGGDPPRVIALDMTDMGLTGFIPSALGRLEQLVGLYLDGNQLTGSVPAELGELKQLNELGLEGNLISGIAKEVEHLANLSVLRWVDGSLAGRMSEPLQEVADTGVSVGGKRGDDVYCRSISRGRLFDLHKDCGVLLSVRDTLSGTVGLNWDRSVPVGAWQGVEVGGRPLRVIGLELPERGLNGRIPSELGELDELIVLNLARNQLAGSIPAELGALKGLTTLQLRDNRLSGRIPIWLSSALPGMFRDNRLNGRTSMDIVEPFFLGVEGNDFEIHGPQWGLRPNLSVLDIEGNDFEGCLPQTLYEKGAHSLVKTGLPHCAPSKSTTQKYVVGELIKKVNNFVDPSTSDGFYASSHNLFLQTALQTGVVGIIFLGLLCTSLIFNLRVRSGRTIEPPQCYVAACTILIITHSTFELFLFRINMGVVAWILIGIGTWVVNHSQHSRK